MKISECNRILESVVQFKLSDLTGFSVIRLWKIFNLD